MLSKRLILFSQLMLYTFMSACTPAVPPQPVTDFDVLFQTSTLSALNAGDFDGEMWTATLLQHGDFGLGTFNALDGEMVMLDGAAYQVRDDGVATVAENNAQTPFAAVTFFEADQSLVMDNAGICADIQTQIDSHLPMLDIPYAIKVSGAFTYLKVRAPHMQTEPYPTLADALVDQVVFESQNISGTMVGFRLPDYLAGANAAGYHFHFISDDKQHGGHVLDCRAQTVTVQIDTTERIHIDVTNPITDPMQGAIKVGALLPLSGPYETLGYELLHTGYGAQDIVNNNGGINGPLIDLVRADTLGANGAGAAAAQAFINAGAVALVGPISPDFAEVVLLINEYKIPMISPSAGTVALDQAGEDYFYRTVPSDSLGGRALALAAANGAEYLGAPYANVVMMVTDAPAYLSFQAPIASGLASAGMEFAATLAIMQGAASYVDAAGEALAHAPDLIILIADPNDSAKVMHDAIAAGYTGRWFFTQDQTTPDFIQLATPELVEGSFGLLEIAAPASQIELANFTELYTQINGHPPQQFATNAHDAVTVLALAMLRADIHDWEVTRATVNANIPLVANPGEGKTAVTSYLEGQAVLMAGGEINYQGISGPIDFDAYGNVVQPYGIFQVQAGAWVQIGTVESNLLQSLLAAE